jgi:hypothetical protein
MTQFDQPYDAGPVQPRKTSSLAITALIFSLVGIIPCLGVLTAPIGLLLGLIGVATIGGKPHLKGKGIAVAAILIGLVLSAAQGYGTYWIVDKGLKVMRRIEDGPSKALTAGFAGDPAGFKDEFHGTGATLSDAEAQAFIDELRDRYGDFVAVGSTKGQTPQPKPGQPFIVVPYQLEFSEATVSAEAKLIIADEQTGGFVMKWGYLEIQDPERGDLMYPPESSGDGGESGSGAEASEQEATAEGDEGS